MSVCFWLGLKRLQPVVRQAQYLLKKPLAGVPDGNSAKHVSSQTAHLMAGNQRVEDDPRGQMPPIRLHSQRFYHLSLALQ